jgi:dephospho-CoA kinase
MDEIGRQRRRGACWRKPLIPIVSPGQQPELSGPRDANTGSGTQLLAIPRRRPQESQRLSRPAHFLHRGGAGRLVGARIRRMHFPFAFTGGRQTFPQHSQPPMLRTLVVTGGIATGKSTFCREFAARCPGARIFDCDAAVHELLTKADIVRTIAASLGGDLLSPDGTLDRIRTSALVFSDPGKRRILEGILHPLVRTACRDARSQASANPAARFFVADVPLFYETGFPLENDLQVLVACAPQTQRQRLLARSPTHDPHLIDQRLAAQMPILDKLPRAHSIIWNGGSRESLIRQTEYFLAWLNLKFPP